MQLTTIIVYSVILFCFFLASYMFVLQFIKIPPLSVRKNLLKLTNNSKKKTSMFDVYINRIAIKISKLIKINPVKRAKLINEYQTLGLSVSPEMQYALAITQGTLCLIISIPLFFLNQPLVGALVATMALLIGLSKINEADKLLTRYRANLERELPRFVAVIEQTLKNERDIEKIIRDYIGDSETPLCSGLRVVLADMSTGNANLALTRFSGRVNSLYLSETMRGLAAALRGDDTVSYFEVLKIKLWENEKIRIEKDYMKKPSKVKFLIFGMMGCMVIIYGVVFGTVIVEGLSGIFGTL